MQEPSNDIYINHPFGSSHCKLDNATDHLHQEKKNYRMTLYLHHRTLKKNPPTK